MGILELPFTHPFHQPSSWCVLTVGDTFQSEGDGREREREGVGGGARNAPSCRVHVYGMIVAQHDVIHPAAVRGAALPRCGLGASARQ